MPKQANGTSDLLDPANLMAVVKAAELGSFTEAGDVLGVQQSVISRRIQRVERALGVPLFTRMSRGVTPTAACNQLVDGIERGFGCIMEAAHGIQASSKRSGCQTLRSGTA